MTGIRTQPVCRVPCFSLCGCSSLTVSVALFQKFLACSSVEKILVQSEEQRISSLSFPMPAPRSKAMVSSLHPSLRRNGTNILQPASEMRFFFAILFTQVTLHYPLSSGLSTNFFLQLRISAACFRSVHILSSNLILFHNSGDLHREILPSVMMSRAIFWTCSLGKRGMDDIALYDHQGAHILGWVGT